MDGKDSCMSGGAEILRSYLTLAPRVDEDALTRAGQQAGKRAGTVMDGELSSGIKRGMSRGAAEGSPEMEKRGADGGKRLGSRLGDTARAAISKTMSASAGHTIGGVFSKGLGEGASQNDLNSKLGAQLDRTQSQSRQAGAVSGKLFAEGYSAGMSDGVDKSFTAAMGNVEAGAGRESGKLKAVGVAMAGHVGGAFKVGLGTAGAAGAGLIGLTLTKGFERLTAIDDARAKLTGLGNSATNVDSIMKNALTSVKGTSFGMGEAATTAAGAVAAGVKPGKDLERTLKLTADAATIAGTDMGSMGSIFNKVATSNKIQGDTIAQLSDAGIPVVQMLSKELGVSADQVVDLASKGKINFAQFQNAMQQGLGGAAQSSGKTFSGAMKNFQAALGRIGANLMGGIFPKLAPGLTKLTKAMEPLEATAKRVGTALGDRLSKGLAKMPSLISQAQTKFSGLWASMKSPTGANGAGSLSGVFTKIGDAFKKFMANFDPSKLSGMFSSLGRMAPVANSGLQIFGSVLGTLASHADLVAKALPFLIAAWAAHRAMMAASVAVGKQSIAGFWAQTTATTLNAAATLANRGALSASAASNRALAISNYATAAGVDANTAAQDLNTASQNKGIFATIRGRIATVASRGAMLASAAASRVMAAGQWILNAALNANPISLIIIGLIALGAALIVAWNKSATFRRIVTAAWDAIKSAALAVWDWMSKTLWPGLKAFFTSIGSGMVAAKDAVVHAWNLVQGAFLAVWNWVSGIFQNNWKTILTILSGPVGWAVSWIRKHWDGIKAAFTAAKDWVMGAFRTAWNVARTVVSWPIDQAQKVISRSWDGIQSAFSTVKDWVMGVFKRAWDGLKTLITDPVQAGKNIIDNILGKDDNSGIRGLFNNAVAAVGRIWDKLKEIVHKPIKGVVDFVINPFIRGFNAIGKVFNLTLDEIKLADGGVVPARADGGFIPGPWRGPKADNVLGVSDAGAPVARVNPMEYRTRGQSVRRVEKRYPGLMDRINRTGSIPSFAFGGMPTTTVNPGDYITNVAATQKMERNHPGVLGYIDRHGDLPRHGDGGWAGMPHANTGAPHTKPGRVESYRPSVSIVALGNYLRSKGFSVTENPAFGGVTPYPGHMKTSLHYAGQAIDINADNFPGGEDRALSALAPALIQQGWGTVWHSDGHWNHLHADTGIVTKINNHLQSISKTNALTDALGDAVSFVSDLFSGKLKGLAYKGIDGLVSKFGGGDFTKKFVGGAARKLIDGALSWGDGQAGAASGGSDGGVGDLKAPANASGAVAIGKAMAAQLGWTGSQWDALYQLWMHESNWNYRADNPTSDAYGIPQSLPGSKMASAGADWRTNPATQIRWGLGYIKGTYGSPAAAWAKWNARRPNWYSEGGLIPALAGGGFAERDLPVFDSGGTLAPGINVVNNKTGAPEPLVRPEHVEKNERSMVLHFHGFDRDDGARIANEIAYNERRLMGAGKYGGVR